MARPERELHIRPHAPPRTASAAWHRRMGTQEESYVLMYDNSPAPTWSATQGQRGCERRDALNRTNAGTTYTDGTA